ncbi:hypothetical protein BDF14DRAFT_1816265 [Spinellus fusiger]|nr:hypothetical protein BDF14DRAFT_1816265 [Spinellus fusiger]
MVGVCRCMGLYINTMTYTGVPRIIQDTLPSYLSSKEACSDSPDWSPYGAYMETSRINVNVRQVFS